jgi:hypothetical protein
MLGKALAGSPVSSGESTPCKRKDAFDRNSVRNASSCSLSTMAGDDVSECTELPASGFKRMPKVWSSGSVSSMVSWSEMSEAEFELNTEDSAIHEARSGKSRGRASREEFSHSLVPRNHNLEEMYNQSSKGAPPTTMMIRNIPSRYSQTDLMNDLKDLGFAGTFDFLYIPMDKNTTANVGYAFVNFIDATWAQKCMRYFQNYRFKRSQRGSSKLASVSVAHMQGLEKNLQHYENTAVNASKHTMRRPVVMAKIATVF